MAADMSTLEALQALHQDLVAIRDGRPENAESFENPAVQELFLRELARVWKRPARSDQSRNAVKSGKISIDDAEYSVNEDFQQIVFNLADETEVDEIEAARYALEAQDDMETLGRSLLECAIIRFHQHRKYVLDCLRLMFEIDVLDEHELDPEVVSVIQQYLSDNILKDTSNQPIVPRCMDAMQDVRSWLARLADKLTAAAVLQEKPQGWDTLEFSRASLVQQHELLGVILCAAVDKKHAEEAQFKSLIGLLKKTDKYDVLLTHLFPAVGAFITNFGSTEGGADLQQARNLDTFICRPSDDRAWPLPSLQAAVKAWWLAEYSGWYLDDSLLGGLPGGVDLDAEDQQRSKQFFETMREGAFDFMLCVLADVNADERQDPSRTALLKWLTRKTPTLAAEIVPFSSFFKTSLATQMEVFVDAFISNLPDVLRKLRSEEDEQRQLSQAHEQDADLERFLIVIALAYENRPQDAVNFWSDPDSNLAGFMHWASRRASTPLVTAFCDMLQAVSGTESCATAAHDFLLDEGHHASGKMRRSQSLTWHQIFKELTFFANKTRDAPPPPPQASIYRGRPSSDQAEAEPESEMMLQAYLGLIAKLVTNSTTARDFLLKEPGFNLVEICFQLASSPILPHIRASVFTALGALLTGKSLEESHIMWSCLENWMCGGYVPLPPGHPRPQLSAPEDVEQRIGDELCSSPEEGIAFVQFLIALVSPAEESSSLNDTLSFPESLGSAFRMPGIELYVDLVLGTLSSAKINDANDAHQARVLSLSCLRFALLCLQTFNEDLIILAHESNIQLDTAIGATDLATYVRVHPFARVMEWMFNDSTIATLYKVIHQEASEVGNAPPESPIIQGILVSVEVISKVLDLQFTYLDLVKPLIKQATPRRTAVANTAYAAFEDGLAGHLNLVVDLGSYCGIGHPDLTLACLKLLERMSSAPKITAAWTLTSGRQTQRNRAIIAMEANGDDEAISRTLTAEILAPFDFGREAESPNYLTKLYILDFIHSCLAAMPNQPTIAHLLLGFQCGVGNLSIDAKGPFAERTSLFHSILRLLLETPAGDAQGMRQWLITLKLKSMQIMKILWSSALSGSFVIDELRENDVLFHLLMRDVVIQPALPWEGEDISQPQFPLSPGPSTLIDFLALRSMTLEYITMELCSISQSQLPSVKRRILEALNGKLSGDDGEAITIPTIFDLYDFLLPHDLWETPEPDVQFYSGLDLRPCLGTDIDGVEVANIDRVKEILLLKQNEKRAEGVVITEQDNALIEREEALIIEHLTSADRQRQIAAQSLKVLRTWTNLLLVMAESNDFKGTAQISFLLQTLQAILPGLEMYASEKPAEAAELARLGKVLLFKLDLASKPTSSLDKDGQKIGSLVSDKLYQLFQISLQAIGLWAGSSDLRAIYYGICYRYLTATVEGGLLASERPKALKAIQVYGEGLLNVICDDAYGSDTDSQTAAMILLNAMVTFSREESSHHVIEVLNKLNFIGLVVDSMRSILDEWSTVIRSGNMAQETYISTKLALLLQLSQTRLGAKYVLHANLMRAVEQSGLFAADPELQVDPAQPKALEKHYEVLAKVVHIVSAAVVCRGESYVAQGRKFLTDHRMLVTHTLKRSAGIGALGEGKRDGGGLELWVDELAEGFMVLIAATGFLEHENNLMPESKTNDTRALFH